MTYPTGRGLWWHPLTVALLGPFAPGVWPATTHLVLGLPLGVVTCVVVVTLLALGAGGAVTVILGVVAAAFLLWSVRLFTAVQRSRFASVLGVRIPPVRRRFEGRLLSRQLAELRSPATWRQVTYHVLALPLGLVGLVTAVVGWSVALALALVPLYRQALPERDVLGIALHDWGHVPFAVATGVFLLFLVPWVVRGIASIDVAAAQVLLGPSRAEMLSERVESLALSRAGAVDAAAAERRRIERDLHDGTQQRLVSLAMNLGMARAELGDDIPERARHAIARAHDEAKQALAELREFVRGLHPAVLDDRGLDAALSGIAARSPVPVRLRVDVASRCSPTIEAIAYFVVSEALTNIAKHARARRADVSVHRVGDRLRVNVADDGSGGARQDGGTGLRGLAQRVAAVDGTFQVDSPPGGPTMITVVLPCES